jgi:hypothetical protein
VGHFGFLSFEFDVQRSEKQIWPTTTRLGLGAGEKAREPSRNTGPNPNQFKFEFTERTLHSQSTAAIECDAAVTIPCGRIDAYIEPFAATVALRCRAPVWAGDFCAVWISILRPAPEFSSRIIGVVVVDAYVVPLPLILMNNFTVGIVFAHVVGSRLVK